MNETTKKPIPKIQRSSPRIVLVTPDMYLRIPVSALPTSVIAEEVVPLVPASDAETPVVRISAVVPAVAIFAECNLIKSFTFPIIG